MVTPHDRGDYLKYDLITLTDGCGHVRLGVLRRPGAASELGNSDMSKISQSVSFHQVARAELEQTSTEHATLWLWDADGNPEPVYIGSDRGVKLVCELNVHQPLRGEG